MKLYRVEFSDGGGPWFVEARSMGEAQRLWLKAMRGVWESDWTGEEEPDAIALVHDEPVIREGER